VSRRSWPYPLGVLARTARTRGFGEHAVGMNQRPRYAVICSPAVGLARRLREGASGTAVRPGSVWLLGGDRNTFERGHQGVPCQWSWTCTRALTCADQIRWQWRVAPACRSKRSRDAVGGSVATQSESMTRATRPFAPGRSGRSQGHRPAEIVRPTGARSFRDHQPGPTMVARQPQRDQLQWQHVKSNGTGRRACSPTLVNGWGHRGINRGNRKASRRMRANLSTASQ